MIIRPAKQRNDLHQLGNGWLLKHRAFVYFMVHTTNGNQGSTLEQEERFLLTNVKRDSLGRWASVSAHYLLGKQGQTIQLLNPDLYVAIHTGATWPGKSNAYALGVEMHYTPAEERFPARTWKALTDLKLLYPLLLPITHREAAIPPGRKKDPSGISNQQFHYWKTNHTKPTKIITAIDANIRQQPTRKSPIVQTVDSEEFMVYGNPVEGEYVGANNQWWYLNGIGYVHTTVTQ